MSQKTKCKLIIDGRERNVIRHEVEWARITYEIINNQTTGDYVICGPNNKIICVFERKSLEDFAASFKDGRAGNINKLLTLRAETGCRIYYIIEGPAYPKPSDTFGNIAYFNIESSITHLSMRDGVQFMYTKDTLHTAQKLAAFVLSCDTLYVKEGDNAVSALNMVPIEQMTGGEEDPAKVRAMLTKVHVKSDVDILREMWACWRGVAITTADEFIKKYSVADIICNKVERKQLSEFKTANGRALSKNVINGLCGHDRALEIKLLTKIPGISNQTANDLVAEVSLKDLLSYSPEAISIRKIGKAKKNLGMEKATRLLRLFNLCNPVINNVAV